MSQQENLKFAESHEWISTGEEIANMTGSSQPAVSRGVNRAKEILRSLEEAALPANKIQEEELSLEKMISEVLSELV